MGEEVRVIYNVFHEPSLGWPIAVYFYMTGLSAGSFIMSTLAYGFGVKKFKPLGKIGVTLAVILLVLAPINLIIDLGVPLRAWHLFPYLNAASPITYGSFLLTIYPINCMIYGFFMFTHNDKLTKAFGLIGIPLALSVHGYTGFILAMSKARALWNTALMPFLFLVSAMVSGIAMMMLVLIIWGKFFTKDRKVNESLLWDLSAILSVTIGLDLFLVFSDVAVLLTADSEAREAAMLILTMNFSPIFVGGEIILGSIIPVLLMVLPWTRRRVFPTAIAAFLVMAGIMCMRYVMVIGGQSVPLS